MPRLCNPVLLTNDLTQSFRVHTFSLREDPWPNFSFRVAYAHRIFDDATQCKSCFRIASASACLELSSATAAATFRYAGFSLRKRNSRTSPLCNFIVEVFDAAQIMTSNTTESQGILRSCNSRRQTETSIEDQFLWMRLNTTTSWTKPIKHSFPVPQSDQ